jgi:hypothetical protein
MVVVQSTKLNWLVDPQVCLRDVLERMPAQTFQPCTICCRKTGKGSNIEMAGRLQKMSNSRVLLCKNALARESSGQRAIIGRVIQSIPQQA